MVRGQYKYRIIGQSQPPPIQPQPLLTRTSRHYDTREDLGPGPYLHRDNFFNSGFLGDLLGLSKQEPSYATFQGKREIQHKPLFPGFFSSPSAPSHRPVAPPPPPPSSPFSVSYSKPSPPPPVPKKYHSPTQYKNDSPYKYTVKGATTHYVDKPAPSPNVLHQGYHPAPRIQPSPPLHSTPKHFNIESSFLQSAKSGHEYASPTSDPQHKVKSFVHKPDPPPSTSFEGLVGSPFSTIRNLDSVKTSEIKIPAFPAQSRQAPSMADLINHIDKKSENHKIFKPSSSSSSSSLPPTSTFKTVGTSPFTSFDNFEVKHVSTTEVYPKKKDVFQLFKKLPETFSLVADVDQDIPEMENTIASAPIPSFKKYPAKDIEESNYRKPSKTIGNLPNHNKIIQPKPDTDKIRVSSLLSDPTTTTSRSFTSSTSRTLLESSSAPSPVKARGSYPVSRSGTASPSKRSDRKKETYTRQLQQRPKIKPKQRVVKKKTSFSSFPYRDSAKSAVKYNEESKDKIRKKSGTTGEYQKLVSLEDKQENKEESLQKLLDIAGTGWSSDNKDNNDNRRNSSSRRHSQQHNKKQIKNQRTPFKCPEPEGHFADESDCSSVYYRCVHGRATRLTCGAGLVWNMDSGQCDWEKEVGCNM